MGRVIAAYAYSEGQRAAEIQLGESAAWAKDKSDFVWIGAHEPTEHDLRVLQAQFGLHELAVEDALNAHQVPKVEVYGESLFVVLRTAELMDGRIGFGETHVFVGCDYIITVRHGASRTYGDVRARCESRPQLLKHGVDYVLHAILDFVVDNYIPAIKELEEEVDGIEERIINDCQLPDDTRRIFELRRELVRLGRVVGPMAEVCSRLRHIEVSFIDKEVRPYFKDVLDHVRRVSETIDALREVLSFAFESAMLKESAKQSDVNRQFAAWAAILAVPTAIAGIYGMNFQNMPELNTQYGYFVVLGIIVTACAWLYISFKRSGWL
ncbi:MAG: magnesium/cobalt transporter CorA [Geminicoccaceae bacterium]